MSLDDKNIISARVIRGAGALTTNDSLSILDSSEEDGEFDLQLPAGINNLYFKFGCSQASIDNNVVWTLLPLGADVIDAAVGALGAAPKAIVFKNGTWFLAI